MWKIASSPGPCPGPHWGAYSAPTDPLAGGEGKQHPPPQEPSPSRPFGPHYSALRASPLPPPHLSNPPPIGVWERRNS